MRRSVGVNFINIVSLISKLSLDGEFHGIVALNSGGFGTWRFLNTHKWPKRTHWTHRTNHRLVVDHLVLMVLHHLVPVFSPSFTWSDASNIFRNGHIQILVLLHFSLSLKWLSLRIVLHLAHVLIDIGWHLILPIVRGVWRIKPSIIILEVLLVITTVDSTRNLIGRPIRAPYWCVNIFRRSCFANPSLLWILDLLNILNFLIDWISHDLIVVGHTHILDLRILRIYRMRCPLCATCILMPNLILTIYFIHFRRRIRHTKYLSSHMRILLMLNLLSLVSVVYIWVLHMWRLLVLQLFVLWIIWFSQKILAVRHRELSRISLLLNPRINTIANTLISWRILPCRVGIGFALNFDKVWCLNQGATTWLTLIDL